jgi:hypothetical protein
MRDPVRKKWNSSNTATEVKVSVQYVIGRRRKERKEGWDKGGDVNRSGEETRVTTHFDNSRRSRADQNFIGHHLNAVHTAEDQENSDSTQHKYKKKRKKADQSMLQCLWWCGVSAIVCVHIRMSLERSNELPRIQIPYAYILIVRRTDEEILMDSHASDACGSKYENPRVNGNVRRSA